LQTTLLPPLLPPRCRCLLVLRKPSISRIFVSIAKHHCCRFAVAVATAAAAAFEPFYF
jgi:hypothetical protein